MPNLPEHAPAPPPNIIRITLVVMFIACLVAAVMWILRPFIAPAIWAALIVVSCWPVLLRIERRVGGRRKTAVAIMVTGLFLLLAVPLAVLILALLQNASEAIDTMSKLPPHTLDHAPSWLSGLPYMGHRIAALWDATAAGGSEGVWATVSPYAGQASAWLLGSIGGIGSVLVQIAVILLFTAIMFTKGEAAAETLVRMFRRLGGHTGETMVLVSGKAIRSVALGVGLSAVIEAAIAGAGMAVIGMPYAGLLTVVIFLCALVQIGPTLVMVPLIAWQFWEGETGAGAVLVAVFGIVLAIDNLLGPVLIRKGIDLPTLVILAGVVGGLLAMGLMGIFVGPVILAVAYTLLGVWVEGGEQRLPPTS